jgi:hypothetical protein
MRYRTLGICGADRSGKTTLAKAVAAELARSGRSTLDVPFAKVVKVVAYGMGWNGKKDARGRRLLRLIGTECGRNCVGPDCWTSLWSSEANGSAYPIIADDLRFENEAEAVRDRDGLVVRLVRSRGPLTDAWTRLTRPFRHASNRDNVKADRTYVVRDGDIDRLHEIAAELAEEMMG